MNIQLSPLRPAAPSDAPIVVKSGDCLTINGQAFDFSTLPEGKIVMPEKIPCDWFAGPVERRNGNLRLTLWLHHGSDPEPWQAFPEPLFNVPDGPVDLPTDTTVTVEDEPVEGGIKRTTTTRRWHQPDQVNIQYLQAPTVEANDVDA